MLDFASPTQALATVRVRINTFVLILTRTLARAWVGEAKSSIRISSSRGALSDLGDGRPSSTSLYAGADHIVSLPSRKPCSCAEERNTRSKREVSPSYIRSK